MWVSYVSSFLLYKKQLNICLKLIKYLIRQQKRKRNDNAKLNHI